MRQCLTWLLRRQQLGLGANHLREVVLGPSRVAGSPAGPRTSVSEAAAEPPGGGRPGVAGQLAWRWRGGQRRPGLAARRGVYSPGASPVAAWTCRLTRVAAQGP